MILSTSHLLSDVRKFDPTWFNPVKHLRNRQRKFPLAILISMCWMCVRENCWHIDVDEAQVSIKIVLNYFKLKSRRTFCQKIQIRNKIHSFFLNRDTKWNRSWQKWLEELSVLMMMLMMLMMSSPWLQPVVQRAESGPRLDRTGDQRDARRAGQPTERRGE